MDHHVGERASGLRQVRRWSNWTAAALVAATALTTGYFARAATSSGGLAAGTGVGTVSGQRSTTAASPGHKCVYVPVATSGGSAVRTQMVLSCGPAGSTAAATGVTQPAGQAAWHEAADGHDS